MKKCILFSRVSTVLQSYEQQTVELASEAKRNGYSDDELLIIEWKETAIHKDFSERESVQMLINAIEQNPIECVICREISRLARRADVLYKIRNYLLEHNIQLISTTPYMRLLDNGKMTQSANITFSIFGAIAESEMQIKKERLAEGKARQKLANKWIGGTPSFGYSVDSKTHTLYINKEAELVKRIFESYIKPQYSAASLAQELLDEGTINHTDIHYAKIFVLRILRNKHYLGNNLYPQIISNDIFEIAEAKRMSAKIQQRHTHNSDNCLAKHIYRTFDNKWVYICRSSVNKYECTILKESISIEIADRFAWECAKDFKIRHTNILSVYKTLQNEVARLYNISETKLNKITAVDDKIDKVNERYIEGFITKEKANDMIGKYNSELAKLKSELFTICEQMNYKEKQLEESKNPANIDYDMLNNKDKIDIIHDCIDIINIERIKKYNLNLHVHYKDGSIEIYYMNTFKKIWNKC